MKWNINVRDVIKLNLLYVLLQLLFIGISYTGVFNLFIKNCYGSYFCNINLVVITQIVINVVFLIVVRQKFIGVDLYVSRLFNTFLSSLLLIAILNYLIYLISYKPIFLPVSALANLFFLIFVLVIPFKLSKHKKNS